MKFLFQCSGKGSNICGLYCGDKNEAGMCISVLGYEKIDESKMDPPEADSSGKVNKDTTEIPPIPCRGKRKQQIKRNRTRITTPGVSGLRGGVASDTDSDYEYVANPMKKHIKSTVFKSHKHLTEAGLGDQCKGEGDLSGNQASGDNKYAFNGINEDNGENQELPKGWAVSNEIKGLRKGRDDSSMCIERSQQDIYCSHGKDENNNGYQKLIKETMTPLSLQNEYQRPNKGTMVSPSALMISYQTEPRRNRLHINTIWPGSYEDLWRLVKEAREVT